jgi:hypothetical protein
MQKASDAANTSQIEDHRRWTAWTEAWLREYRCRTRYLALLAMDAAEELELRFAWLEWWDAECVCREASLQLDNRENLRTGS